MFSYTSEHLDVAIWLLILTEIKVSDNKNYRVINGSDFVLSALIGYNFQTNKGNCFRGY